MEQSENKHRFWLSVFNAFTLLTAVVVSIWSVNQFFIQEERKLYKSVWDLQLETYIKVVELARKSAYGKKANLNETLIDLEVLAGKLTLLGDGNIVGSAHYVIDSTKKCIKGDKRECELLKKHSYKLAECARLSLAETASRKISELETLPNSYRLDHRCFNGENKNENK